MLNRPTLYENRTASAHSNSGTVLASVSPKYFSLEFGFLNQKKFLMTFMIELKAPEGLIISSTTYAISRPRIMQTSEEMKDCTPGLLKKLTFSLLMP